MVEEDARGDDVVAGEVVGWEEGCVNAWSLSKLQSMVE
jgi:hypothetical protein